MVNCWPLILHVTHHTRHTITRHVGRRIMRHVVIHAHRAVVIVCAGGITALPGPLPEIPSTAPDVILMPPQFIYQPEARMPEVQFVPADVPPMHPITEPGTLIVLAGGVAILAAIRRRPCARG